MWNVDIPLMDPYYGLVIPKTFKGPVLMHIGMFTSESGYASAVATGSRLSNTRKFSFRTSYTMVVKALYSTYRLTVEVHGRVRET